MSTSGPSNPPAPPKAIPAAPPQNQQNPSKLPIKRFADRNLTSETINIVQSLKNTAKELTEKIQSGDLQAATDYDAKRNVYKNNLTSFINKNLKPIDEKLKELDENLQKEKDRLENKIKNAEIRANELSSQIEKLENQKKQFVQIGAGELAVKKIDAKLTPLKEKQLHKDFELELKTIQANINKYNEEIDTTIRRQTELLKEKDQLYALLSVFPARNEKKDEIEKKDEKAQTREIQVNFKEYIEKGPLNGFYLENLKTFFEITSSKKVIATCTALVNKRRRDSLGFPSLTIDQILDIAAGFLIRSNEIEYNDVNPLKNAFEDKDNLYFRETLKNEFYTAYPELKQDYIAPLKINNITGPSNNIQEITNSTEQENQDPIVLPGKRSIEEKPENTTVEITIRNPVELQTLNHPNSAISMAHLEQKLMETQQNLNKMNDELIVNKKYLKKNKLKRINTQNELTKAQQKLTLTKHKFTKAQVQSSQFQQELLQTQEELKQTQQQWKETQDELFLARKQVNQTQPQLDVTKSKLEQTEEKFNQNKYQLTRTNQNYNDTLNQLRQMEDVLVLKQELLIKTQQESDHTSVQLEIVQKDFELFKNTTQDEFRQQKIQLTETQKERDQARVQFNSLQQELDRTKQLFKSELGQIQEQLNITKQECDQGKVKLDNAQQERDQIKLQLDNTQQERNQIKLQLDNTKNLYQLQLTKSQQERDLNQQQLSNLQQEFKNLLEQAQNKLTQNQQQLTNTQQERDQANIQLSNTQQDFSKLKQEFDVTKNILDFTKILTVQTQNDLNQTQKHLVTIQQERDKIKLQLDNTQQNLEQTQNELAQTKKQLTKTQEERDQAEVQRGNTQQNLSLNHLQLNKAQQQLNQTQQHVHQTQQQLNQTQLHYYQTQQQLTQTKQELVKALALSPAQILQNEGITGLGHAIFVYKREHNDAMPTIATISEWGEAAGLRRNPNWRTMISRTAELVKEYENSIKNKI